MNIYIKEHNGYLIQPHKDSPNCYTVATSGRGGKIPDILGGLYTTRALAMSEIDHYIATRQPKEKINDEAIEKGRSK